MSRDTDCTPIQTPGEAQLLANGAVEIDIEADRERAILTLCTDGVAITASLFPGEIEQLQDDLSVAAARIDPEKATQAQTYRSNSE